MLTHWRALRKQLDELENRLRKVFVISILRIRGSAWGHVWGHAGAVPAAATVVILAGCGGNHQAGPTAVDPIADTVSTPEVRALATLPPYFEGFYVLGPDAHTVPGNVEVLILSWGDDIEAIARVMATRGQLAFVSTHCCLWPGGRFDPAQWERIETEWLTPLRRAGVLAGVYLVDEPRINGISDDEVARGAAFVSAQGLPTMAVRANLNSKRLPRLPVDYYSFTCYDFAGPGGTKKEWCRDEYRRGAYDFVVGQAFDGGKGMPDQAYWRETAREAGVGIISWVWRWSGQTGCADDPACLATWR